MGFGDKIPMGIQTGQSGTLMGSAQVITLAAGTANVPTAGDYFMRTVGANIRLEILDEGGVWQPVTAVGVGGYFSFDGTNVRVNNTGGAQQSVTLQKAG